MRRFYLIGFGLLVMFDTLGQICFKQTAIHAEPLEFSALWLLRVFSAPWVYVAIAGYVATFFTWMTLLKRAPVGPAFAASHLEVVTAMIASIWIFNENITLLRLTGAILIVSGIICLALAEKQIAAEQENDVA
jgi:drug/metabolite transporter (DMT)-like permease